MQTEKSREARLRRVAARRMWQLQKCRKRDPYGIGYGTYQLSENGHIIACEDKDNGYGMTLDEVEDFLKKP